MKGLDVEDEDVSAACADVEMAPILGEATRDDLLTTVCVCVCVCVCVRVCVCV